MTRALAPVAPALRPWALRPGETAEDAVAFWAWRYGVLPVDPELAEKYEWAKRANALDVADEVPLSVTDLVATSLAHELTAQAIGAKQRDIRAHEDPDWAATHCVDLATYVKIAAGIEIPDRTDQIDFRSIYLDGRITSEELELLEQANRILRRIGAG